MVAHALEAPGLLGLIVQGIIVRRIRNDVVSKGTKLF